MKTRYDRGYTRVAVIGGPSTGKTSVMSSMQTRLESRSYRGIIVPETASRLMSATFSPNPAMWESRHDFQRFLLTDQLHTEDLYLEMALREKSDKHIVLICDRGALDAIAYVGKNGFEDMLDEFDGSSPSRTTIGSLRDRYDLVICLEGKAEFYTRENNAQRHEEVEEALTLGLKTLQAWAGHPHLAIIPADPDFHKKKINAFNAIGRVLRMPAALEKERKFVWPNFDVSLIPSDAVRHEITQTYLSLDHSMRRSRVRKDVVDGHASYTHTSKVETGEKGVRGEDERKIRRSEYEEYLLQQDPKTITIRKTRYDVFFGNQKFEVDVFQEPVLPCALVEAEVQDMKAPVIFPSEWPLLTEVTDKEGYSNYDIAKNMWLRS